MKKKSLTKKLDLKKINISRLENLNKIVGGFGTHTGTEGDPICRTGSTPCPPGTYQEFTTGTH